VRGRQIPKILDRLALLQCLQKLATDAIVERDEVHLAFRIPPLEFPLRGVEFRPELCEFPEELKRRKRPRPCVMVDCLAVRTDDRHTLGRDAGFAAYAERSLGERLAKHEIKPRNPLGKRRLAARGSQPLVLYLL